MGGGSVFKRTSAIDEMLTTESISHASHILKNTSAFYIYQKRFQKAHRAFIHFGIAHEREKEWHCNLITTQ
jgi:hypothetical protein